MIAFVERLLPDADADDTTTATGDGVVPVDLQSCSVPDRRLFARDFGGLLCSVPAAVLRPTTADEIARLVRVAVASPALTVAARGNGHSAAGQSLAGVGGVVVDMSAFCDVEVSPDGESALVGAGALWEDVLARAVEVSRRSPRSWTDYLGLTVGGTLSNGGVSGQAFKHGPQTSNVLELEVVTGNGEIMLCSDSDNSDLFFSVLGGLGQFGVVTRARIPLDPAPDMVRWIRLVYTDFELYVADAESLVSRGNDSVDYLEGFVFVNNNDPINGWGSVPISPDSGFDPDRIPCGSGPVLYCLELVLYYNHHQDCDGDQSELERSVDQRMGDALKDLRHVRGLEFVTDVGYVDFLTRVKRAEEAAKANGTWDAPHPWLNLFLSSADIVDFDRNIFKKILRNGIDGPMLVYPLLKSKWDPRTSVALPEGEIFYLVALLRFCRPFPDGRPVEDLVAENEEIIDHCVTNGYDLKVYIPHYKTEVLWKQHFGNEWSRFVERKARYDPMAVIAPGQKIFPRTNEPPFTR